MIAFINGVTLDGYIKQQAGKKSLVLYEGYSESIAKSIFNMVYLLGDRPYFGTKQVRYEGREIGTTYSVSIDSNNAGIIPVERHKRAKLTRTDRIVYTPDINDGSQDKYMRRKNALGIKYCKESTCEKNGLHYNYSTFLRRVTDITHSSANVYDIEVANTHTYCIGGVISHNTINLPKESTVQDVMDAYLYAYETECRNLSVYRDGSRDNQVLSTGATEAKKTNGKERPEVLEGFTKKVKTGNGTLFLTVNIEDNKPYELFAQIGKSGWSTMADTEAIGRLVSLAMQAGVSTEEIAKQLIGIGGDSPVYHEGKLVKSIPDAIGEFLNKYLVDGKIKLGGKKCSECNSDMINQGGCYVCTNCGNSKC